MKKPVSTLGRFCWGVMFVTGLIALVTGIVFMFSGSEMIFPAVIFGGAGVFMVFESVGRMMGWEK